MLPPMRFRKENVQLDDEFISLVKNRGKLIQWFPSCRINDGVDIAKILSLIVNDCENLVQPTSDPKVGPLVVRVGDGMPSDEDIHRVFDALKPIDPEKTAHKHITLSVPFGQVFDAYEKIHRDLKEPIKNFKLESREIGCFF